MFLVRRSALCATRQGTSINISGEVCAPLTPHLRVHDRRAYDHRQGTRCPRKSVHVIKTSLRGSRGRYPGLAARRGLNFPARRSACARHRCRSRPAMPALVSPGQGAVGLSIRRPRRARRSIIPRARRLYIGGRAALRDERDDRGLAGERVPTRRSDYSGRSSASRGRPWCAAGRRQVAGPRSSHVGTPATPRNHRPGGPPRPRPGRGPLRPRRCVRSGGAPVEEGPASCCARGCCAARQANNNRDAPGALETTALRMARRQDPAAQTRYRGAIVMPSERCGPRALDPARQ